MAKLSNSLLALCALAYVKVTAGSTEFSSNIALVPSSSVAGPEPHIPVVYSTKLLTTIVPASTESEATTTVFTTTTVTTAITSTIVSTKPSTSVEGHMTVQTSMPSMNLTSSTVILVPGNSTLIMSTTAAPSYGASTIVVTHTANKSSVAKTGAPQPTASASTPPEIVNAASGVDFGFAALAVGIVAAVFGI